MGFTEDVMPLPPPPSTEPGGVVHLEYTNFTAGERHSLHIHLCHFNLSPVGATNDHAYIAGGPVTPSEGHVSDTYAALAALWAAYYDANWVLTCEQLYYNAGGTPTVLTPAPDFPTHVGATTPDDPEVPRFDRRFRLLGHKGAKRHLHLCQVAGTVHQPDPFEVSTTGGGLDARDRALIAYFSGASGGGAVTPDGTYCFPVTDMQVWWARSLKPLGAGVPGSPYIVSG
jgi:hypothetical protein